MSTGPTLLEWLGLKIPDLFAGFAGGVVNSFVFRRGDPWAVVGSLVTGSLVANFFGESAAKMLSLSEGASSFLLGLTAMAIVQGLVAAARNYSFSPPGGK